MSITTTTFVDNKCDDLDGSLVAPSFRCRYRQYSRCKRQPFLEQLGEDGGAVRFSTSSISSVVFSSSLFENNVALYWRRSNLLDTTVDLIHNCTFVRNRADDTLSSIKFNVSLLFYFL